MLKLLIITASYTILVLFFSLLPFGNIPPIIRVIDNLLHVPAYAVFTFLFYNILQSYTDHKINNIIISSICAVVFGIVVEFLQSAVPGRMKSLSDIFLNIIGILAGIAIIHFIPLTNALFAQNKAEA